MLVTHVPNTDPTCQRPQQRSWPPQTPPHQASSLWWSGGRGLSLQPRKPPQRPFSVGSSSRERERRLLLLLREELCTPCTLTFSKTYLAIHLPKNRLPPIPPVLFKAGPRTPWRGCWRYSPDVCVEEGGCIAEVVWVCVGVYVLPLFGRSETLEVFLSSSCVCLSQGRCMRWSDCCETLKTACNSTTSTFYCCLIIDLNTM